MNMQKYITVVGIAIFVAVLVLAGLAINIALTTNQISRNNDIETRLFRTQICIVSLPPTERNEAKARECFEKNGIAP